MQELWGSKTVYSFTNVFKSHHNWLMSVVILTIMKQYCRNKAMNYL